MLPQALQTCRGSESPLGTMKETLAPQRLQKRITMLMSLDEIKESVTLLAKWTLCSSVGRKAHFFLCARVLPVATIAKTNKIRASAPVKAGAPGGLACF